MSDQKRMKIIYLIGELSMGGSERQLYLLLSHMDLTRIEPIVIVFNPSQSMSYHDPLQRAGVTVITIPDNKKDFITRFFFVNKKTRKYKPDVIHSWSAHDNIYGFLLGKINHVPLTLGSFRDSLRNYGFRSLPRIVQRILIHWNQYIVVNARSIKDELVEEGYSKEKIFVLDNCVLVVEKNNEISRELSNITQRETSCVYVGSVCNLHRKKNVDVFINGVANVVREYENVVGLIVGQPIKYDLAYYESLQDLIIKNELEDKVFILGFRDDIPQFMYHLDIFCLLSEFEGTPNVVLEAMAAAKPVIASNTSGIPDIVKHEENGILVAPGDTLEFEAALRKLLSDTRLAGQMGQNGQHRVQEYYNCHNISSQLIRLYQSLLQQ
jgi:glycosyltransferase involved in cell wall biosynthesis